VWALATCSGSATAQGSTIAHGTVAPNGNQYGTDCSATVSVAGNGFSAYGVTFQNSFDPTANPQITSPQAVAVKTVADRVTYAGDRFLGLFDHDTIDMLGHPGGSLSAPDTVIAQKYGYLITRSRIINSPGNLAAGSYYLGRPWIHTGTTDPVPQITIRDTVLPAAISPQQWQNWTSPPFRWQDARFCEYANRGPGRRQRPMSRSSPRPRPGSTRWRPTWPGGGRENGPDGTRERRPATGRHWPALLGRRC
jgi:pectin methylesterase-like acyl-CoA thioesterase